MELATKTLHPSKKKPLSTLSPDIAVCAFCIKSATWKIRALVSSLPHATCTNVISPSVLLGYKVGIPISSPTLVPGCELLAAALPAIQGRSLSYSHGRSLGLLGKAAFKLYGLCPIGYGGFHLHISF